MDVVVNNAVTIIAAAAALGLAIGIFRAWSGR